MTDYERIQNRKAGRAAVRRILDFLTHHAGGDVEKIGKRVEILNFALQRHDEGAEKAKDFADRLGLSESRVSNAVSKVLAQLESILNGEDPKQDPPA